MTLQEATKIRDDLREWTYKNPYEAICCITPIPLSKLNAAMDALVEHAESRVVKVELGWRTAKAIVEESDRQLEIHSKQELLFLGEEVFYITVLENVNNKLNNQ